MWKSNVDPWSTEEPEEWKNFSDIENLLIEEAATKKKEETVILDDYHVDLKRNVQISNYDVNKQRPVKRTVSNEQDDQPLRQSRFMSDPSL